MPCRARVHPVPHRENGGLRTSTTQWGPARTPLPGPLMRGDLPSLVILHPDHPALCSGFAVPAARPSWFQPRAARLPPHPISTAPTTRHDLASVQRTGGESHGWSSGGTDRCTILSVHWNHWHPGSAAERGGGMHVRSLGRNGRPKRALPNRGVGRAAGLGTSRGQWLRRFQPPAALGGSAARGHMHHRGGVVCVA